jgi:molybdate transport system substrate-binding protein
MGTNRASVWSQSGQLTLKKYNLLSMTTPTHLHIISAGAAMGLARTVLGDQVSINVGLNFGAVRTMYDYFVSGVPCDLLLLTRAQIDELDAAGCIVAGSVADVGHVKTGIAVRADTKTNPAIDTAESLKATLEKASSLYCPDMKQSTAGLHVLNMLKKLGIWETMKSKISEHPNGATAMRMMDTSNDAESLGCTQVTEILYTPSVRLVGLLPSEFELSTVYTIAVPKRTTEPEAALAAIAKLCASANQGVRTAAGFDAE